jgi:hypothetical protein
MSSRCRTAPRFIRSGLLVGALLAATGAWSALPATHAPDSARMGAVVWLRQVGIVYPAGADSTAPVSIVVYATGPAKVGLSGAEPAALTDTLRLTAVTEIAADVSEADVHIRLLSPGRLRVGGDITGGRAIHLTATGRHIVLLKGGVGATTITDPE